MAIRTSEYELRRTIEKKVFNGRRGQLGPRIQIIWGTGAASGAALVGTYYVRTTNSAVYICTVATGTWVQISA